PFAAWIDALRRPGRDLCDEVVARLGDARAGQATDAASAARARSRLFDDVVDALEWEAAGRPQVLVLEDVHWADTPTLARVRRVAAHLPAMAALVAVTFRDDELDPAELAGIGGAAEWLTLTGLPEDEVAPVLAAALGREPSADEVRSVHRQTGGNPLFVTQVGRLLAAGAPATVPTGVREVLARRLARLSVACDRVLVRRGHRRAARRRRRGPGRGGPGPGGAAGGVATRPLVVRARPRAGRPPRGARGGRAGRPPPAGARRPRGAGAQRRRPARPP